MDIHKNYTSYIIDYVFWCEVLAVTHEVDDDQYKEYLCRMYKRTVSFP